MSWSALAPTVRPPSRWVWQDSSALSETLRSVAATRSWPLLVARRSTLASIGIVLFRSAMFWARRRPFRNSALWILNSMALVSSLLRRRWGGATLIGLLVS